MADRDWPTILTRVADAVADAVPPLIGADQDPLRRGAGGDRTLPLDETAEQAARDVLADVGDLRLITEEAGTIELGDPEAVVMMDPVDGSHNARVGLPAYAISLAVAPVDGTLGDVHTGLIRNLATGDVYLGVAGDGTTLNGEAIHASDATDGWTLGVELWPPGMVKSGFWERVLPVLKSARRVRSLGSTALDLGMVAQGAVDVHVDVRGTGRVLDLSAAYRILEEAGAVVTDDLGERIDDRLLDLDATTNLVASGNADLHGEVLELLA